MPVPTNYRWLLEDPQANIADYRVPINPNKMSSPYKTRSLETMGGVLGRIRTRFSPTAPNEWTWSGVIRTSDHYEKLLEFSRCDNNIHITDHLGQTWDVMPLRFNADEKRPSVRQPFKYSYDFVCWVLGGPL